MQVQNNMVGWFEIHVDNMERAKKFYQGVFSREMIDLPSENKETQMCMFFSSGDMALGASGALVKSNHLKPGIGGSLVYFTCEDCANEGSRVIANGGSLFKEKTSIGEYGHIALVKDSEGNLIGLHSMK
jgi:predicted enzyme related to lactoylglutathione lyase